MGMISWLTGSQAANRNVSRSSANGLRDALLALNSPSRPWLVRPGLPGEADLVAMWNVDSPDWHDKLFGAMLDLNLKILLRLDESSYTVRSIDKSVVVGSDPQRRGQISWGKGRSTRRATNYRSASGVMGQSASCLQTHFGLAT